MNNEHNKLVWNAVPRLFENLPHPPSKTPIRKPPSIRKDLPDQKKRHLIKVPSSTSDASTTSSSGISTPKNKNTSDSSDSPTKSRLRRKLNFYRVQVFRLKQKMCKPNKNKKILTEKYKIKKIGEQLSDFVKGEQYDFIMSQIKNANKLDNSKRWT